ncbi:MAG TPA: hypothetical protein VD861_10385, partial [Pyrinomonadaceae bacterium]|nr:hypothetical protein [Pyrinomonadaceae bacterium]
VEPPPTEVLDDPALAPTRPARGKSSAATPRAELTWEAEPRRTMPQSEKRRSTGSVVAFTVLATVLALGLGGVIVWQLMKDDKQGVAETRNTGNANANVTGNTNDSSGGVVSTPTPTATPTPASGFIEGSMAYPSDAIPGVMVACAENVETRATVCSEKRDDWEAGVRYSLKVPPGRYFVYATLLPGDDSVGEMQGKKAYYTDYMKCGMGENCNSHKRIVVEVPPDQTLSGIIVGGWWADL